MHAVLFADDERLHGGMPFAALVTEVHACFDEFLKGVLMPLIYVLFSQSHGLWWKHCMQCYNFELPLRPTLIRQREWFRFILLTV